MDKVEYKGSCALRKVEDGSLNSILQCILNTPFVRLGWSHLKKNHTCAMFNDFLQMAEIVWSHSKQAHLDINEKSFLKYDKNTPSKFICDFLMDMSKNFPSIKISEKEFKDPFKGNIFQQKKIHFCKKDSYYLTESSPESIIFLDMKEPSILSHFFSYFGTSKTTSK